MPHNTEHWDSMRQYEERMKELREEAKEEGIEISEASISNAMDLLSSLSLAQGEGSEPSRLLIHKADSDANSDASSDVDDEWRIPTPKD